MAAQSATKRSAVRVTSDGGSVHFIGGGEVRSSRGGSRRDGGLWDGDVWSVLHEVDSILGARGTLGGVISVVEHGGVGGSLQHDDVMLRRIGCIEGDPKKVKRAKALIARWRTLDARSQRVLMAHYLLTLRADHKIVARCAGMSGAVILQWLEAGEEKRQGIRAELTDRVWVAIDDKIARLEAEEAALKADQVRPAPTHEPWPELRSPRCKGEERANEAELDRRDVIEERRRVVAARRCRYLARYGLTWVASGRLAALRALRAEVSTLLARGSAVAAVGSVESDLAALVRLCEAGEVAGHQGRGVSREASELLTKLMTGAESAVRAAHEAWAQTGRRAAEAWVEA